MKRYVTGLLSLLILVGSVSLGVRSLQVNVTDGRVYPVAAVTSGLNRDPEAWLGRTVLVRGVAGVTTCAPPPTGLLCAAPRFMLSDANPAPVPARLDLTWTGGGAVLTFLRRLPLVGRVVVAPQVIRWDVVADYHVHLQRERPCRSTCYAAMLPDAAS